MPEVRDHEPILALDGMEDGLYYMSSARKALRQSKKRRRENLKIKGAGKSTVYRKIDKNGTLS